MWKRLRQPFFDAIMVFLLSFGFFAPVLSILSLSAGMPGAMGLAVIIIIILESVRLFPRLRLPLLIPAGALLVVWLSFLGGFTLLTDVVKACWLQFLGVEGALPLMSGPAALILAFLITLVCFFLQRQSSGAFPLLLLCVGVALLLWLSDRSDLILYLFPALLVCLCRIVEFRQGGLVSAHSLLFLFLLLLLAFLPALTGGFSIPSWKEKAEAIRQSVMDRLFFTEPRDVFSLSMEGFYPQGQEQMGGPAVPSDVPVMNVSAPRTVYLRGVILNEYDGHVWKNTSGGRRYLLELPRWRSIRRTLFNTDLPGGKLNDGTGLMAQQQVTVRMLTDCASTLFVPQRMSSITPGGDLVLYFNKASELFATRNLQAGDSYTVNTRLFTSGDAGLATLIHAAADLPDPEYESILHSYTALPGHLEQPIADLAEAACHNQQDAYERAFAIQTWLSRNYRYNLEAEYQPADMDVVTHFLLNTKEGYCTHFASAMTVLCRMVGLPARYVEGFLVQPDESGTAVVTGEDAHAWTEVYFNGFGWVTFDATPGRRTSDQPQDEGSSSNRSEGQTANTPEPTPEPTLEPTPEITDPDQADTDPDEENSPEPENPEETTPPQDEWPTPTPGPEDDSPDQPEDPDIPDEEPEQRPSSLPLFIWILIGLLLLLLMILTLLLIRSRPENLEKSAPDLTGKWEVWERMLQDLFALKGIRRLSDQSPVAWADHIDRGRSFPVSVMPVAMVRTKLSYARLEITENDLEITRRIVTEILKEQKILFRCRIALTRAFRLRHRIN